jgi:hypothetical protein
MSKDPVCHSVRVSTPDASKLGAIPASRASAMKMPQVWRNNRRRNTQDPRLLKTARQAATLALLASSLLAAQTETFTFAGLSLKTTMAELKKRYPRSTALDTLVYLSDEESHDHISTIGLSSSSGARTLTITFEPATFERRRRGRVATYPSCEKSLSRLKGRYGNPADVVDAQEERARNRRFEWKTSTESLTLNCFRMPRQPLYAERLTITAGR